jgi:two-component system chemotaxis sensor kinase CheA
MDDLLREFLTETAESMATLDIELVNLEQTPDDPDLIADIFRLVHTIKGTCGFLGLKRLEKVGHAGENVLGKFRDGTLKVTPEAVGLILESLDRIKDLLAKLEATGTEPEGGDDDLIARLDALAEGGAPPVTTAQAAQAPAPTAETPPAAAEGGAAPVLADSGLGRALKPGEVSLEELEAAFLSATGPAETTPQETAAAEAGKASAKNVVKAAPAEAKAGAKGNEASVANQSIRVSVDLLENLMTMVSELVLSRNQLLQMVRALDNSEFTVPLQRLSHVTTELQEGVMKTRMQPIGNAWAKLPRIVRDLAMELGKKIDLEMIGADTELDRQVLELIKDPLTHMVRNSADHGLETPEQRAKAGKPETGKITLNAFHEGGHIIIQVKDDGRGLDTAKIKRKAIEHGLAGEADLETMPLSQLQQFIFRAGFSTAQKVTNVSGRGVGMDVVRTNIERIGGTVELQSIEGKGSTFTIKIPLTLAIVSALIVACQNERFAIPQISVVELVRSSPGSELSIEYINDTPVLRLRDRLLPLLFLHKTLKLVDGPLPEASENYVVVTQVGSAHFGIVVDQVFDTEEIVVKPVAPILRDIQMFSGNTILGDGSVIMILDPNGLAAERGEGAAVVAAREAGSAARDSQGEEISLLIFRAGGEELKAVPLGLVQRLEEIESKQIERVNGQEVVQYRGHLMPLVRMREDTPPRTEGRQPILVFVEQGRSMGLIVEEIVDILDSALEIEMEGMLPGVIGSAIVSGRATEIIDVAHYLEKAFRDWFKKRSAVFGASAEPRKILLVDDSAFFRNMLVPLLSAAGYQVTTADCADNALKMREAGAVFDAIISDIEMPGMNGFEFVEEIKRGQQWRETPVLALSAHTSRSDVERGRAAGFSDYVGKCDRATLLASLSETIGARGAA